MSARLPPGDAESNYRMTREALLDHVPLKPEQIHRIEGELEPEMAAARYESELRNELPPGGRREPALRPGGAGAWATTATPLRCFRTPRPSTRWAAWSTANHVPQKDTWRITLTWPVINHASSVFFLISGREKAAILQGSSDRAARSGAAAQSTDMALKRYTYTHSG